MKVFMKIAKEVIIMLLVILVGILAFAIALYEYTPGKKQVETVATYEVPATINEQLKDDVEERMEKDIIKTYEQGKYQVTSTDLNKFKNSDKYNPGKSNPFAEISSGEGGEITGKGSGSSGGTSGNSGSTNNNSNGSTSSSANKKGIK